MRKLHFIWLGSLVAMAGLGTSPGCGSDSGDSGGGGPGGGTTTQGTGGSTTSSPGTGGSTTSATTTSTPSTGGSTPGTGGTSGTAGGGGTGGASCAGVNLTVKNFDFWCSVKVGSGDFSTDLEQDVCVDADSVTDLKAKAIAGFELYNKTWHYVDGDPSGAGVQGDVSADPTVSVAHVTVGDSGNMCVWVCCRSKTDTTDCDTPVPVADQCH